MKIRRLLQLGVLLTLFWLPSPSAQAHAEMISSNPAPNAQLSALPSTVSVTYDGNLMVLGSAKTNVLEVRDGQGNQIDDQNSQVKGAVITVGLKPSSATGQFTVSWRVVSGDGHPEQGSYQFSVGDTSGASISNAPQVATPNSTAAPAKDSMASKKGFWSTYQTRLLLLIAAGVGIGIWIRFNYASKRKL